MNFLENFNWNDSVILADDQLSKIKGGGDPPPFADDHEDDA